MSKPNRSGQEREEGVGMRQAIRMAGVSLAPLPVPGAAGVNSADLAGLEGARPAMNGTRSRKPVEGPGSA